MDWKTDMEIQFFQPKEKYTHQEEDAKDFIIKVGFKYFHILQRMLDIAPDGMIQKSSKAM